jgi:ParB/RepB/Spo0J family partition protein
VEQLKIELRHLHPAEGDDAVRKTDKYEGIKALAENIERFGLLVPLLVKSSEKFPEEYDVIDGNRRLVALHEIHEDNLVMVNCALIERTEGGVGAALSANTMRRAMNPMDQYDVFAKLVAEGMKTGKVGKLFDMPAKKVNQVLALASLDPSIKDKVREGQLSWEAAQALTLIRDFETQIVMLEKTGDNPWAIRNYVHNEAPRLETAIFDKNEYYLAGGQLLVDLFDDDPSADKLCADHDLFWKLQHAAIDAELDKLRAQGWKAVLEDGGIMRDHRWPRRAEIRSKKQRVRHSVIYQIHDDGRFQIWEQVLPEPELVKAAKAEARVEKQETKRAEAEAEGVEVEMTGNRPMSSSLVHDLKEARSRQVKLALTGNPRLAGRVLVMLLSMADHRRGYTPRAADLQWSLKTPEEADMEGFPMWRSFNREYETTRQKTLSAMWKALAGATHDELVERLGHVAALAFDAQLPGAAAIAKAILATERVHARSVWKPDAEFWQRCGRAFMLKALEDTVGSVVANRMKNEKVWDLAKRMERWFTSDTQLRWLDFNGKDEPLPAEVKDRLANWTPAILELPRDHQPVEEIFTDQFDSLDEEEFEQEETEKRQAETLDEERLPAAE